MNKMNNFMDVTSSLGSGQNQGQYDQSYGFSQNPGYGYNQNPGYSYIPNQGNGYGKNQGFSHNGGHHGHHGHLD